jgi:hypothetical protein
MKSPSLSTFLTVTALLLSCFAFFATHTIAEEVDESSMSIEEFLDYNIGVFNEGNGTKTDMMNFYPFSFIFENRFVIQRPEMGERPGTNYTSLREAGWAYSDWTFMDTIVETDTTAIIYYEFSRYTADDEPYQSYQWYATLLKNPEGAWRWAVMVVPSATAMPYRNTGLRSPEIED